MKRMRGREASSVRATQNSRPPLNLRGTRTQDHARFWLVMRSQGVARRKVPLGIDDAMRSAMAESPMDLKRILVPTDFGDAAGKALDVAVDLAKKYSASITLLHVYEIPVYPYPGALVDFDFVTPIREAAQKELASAFDALKLRGVEARAELLYGVPWSAILEVAENGKADLIVIGTHGRRGVMHALLGSVAEKVVRLSPVPVLTVRGPEASRVKNAQS
jgi:nucleotide-binding universal stress UspA family protein